MMKKITKKITVGILGLAIFVGGISYVSAQTFNLDTGIITSLFELAPKQKGYASPFYVGGFTDPSATTNSNSLFRLFGSSIFDKITASENVHFDNLLLGSGYTSGTIPVTELQVAGGIQIEQLLDPNSLGDTAYLCVNDFGVLSRCPGVALPSPACHTPAYGGNGVQLATDTATGCDGGEFFDLEDTAGEWKWGCRGMSDSIALTPSHPSDVVCSHVNNGQVQGESFSL